MASKEKGRSGGGRFLRRCRGFGIFALADPRLGLAACVVGYFRVAAAAAGGCTAGGGFWLGICVGAGKWMMGAHAVVPAGGRLRHTWLNSQAGRLHYKWWISRPRRRR